MNKARFCQKYNLTEKQFIGEEWVKHNLTIDEDELPEGFNPKVTGHLELPNLKIIPIWFNPVVGRNLYLPVIISFEPTFDPVVGGWVKLELLPEIPYDWKPTVGLLSLKSITILPDWFDPTVCVVKINNEYINMFRPKNDLYSWRNGQYIMVDWLIIEVVEKRGKVYHVREFGKDEIFYLVTDGNGVFAHGKTLSEAKADLKFKLAKREGAEDDMKNNLLKHKEIKLLELSEKIRNELSEALTVKVTDESITIIYPMTTLTSKMVQMKVIPNDDGTFTVTDNGWLYDAWFGVWFDNGVMDSDVVKRVIEHHNDITQVRSENKVTFKMSVGNANRLPTAVYDMAHFIKTMVDVVYITIPSAIME